MNQLMRVPPGQKRQDACFLVAVVFLFFIIYSAPHRVHHFFEQASSSAARAKFHLRHEQSATDGHSHEPESRQPQQTACAAQLTAQNTHIAPPPLIAFGFEDFPSGQIERPEAASAESFDPAPFSQRAPPLD